MLIQGGSPWGLTACVPPIRQIIGGSIDHPVLPNAMPQLSILIPYTGNEQDLETTLVSVLEHRPPHCEVIVAHTGDYSDPYELSDEVRFLEIDDSELRLGQLLSQVAEETSAPVLHLLICGTRVTPGWTDSVESAFDDPYVGSACPLLSHEDGTVFSVGVENSILYRTRFIGRGKVLSARDQSTCEPVGPAHYAAFYRTQALREITCLTEFGETLLGLELALSLEAIGYETRVLSDSQVYISEEIVGEENPAESQQAIWRFAGSLGLLQGLALTGLGLITDLFCAPFSGYRRRSFFCRCGNLIDQSAAQAFRDCVDDAIGPVTSGQTLPLHHPPLSLTGSELDSDRRRAA